MTANPVTFDTQHEDMIHDAQLDYFGKRLATCSSDRTIRIFEIGEKTQKLVAEIKGHEGPVWQVAWAHPQFGSIIASCSYDHRVIIWKEQQQGQWTKLGEDYKFEASVNSISWAPHELGLILAAACSDSTISIIGYRETDSQWYREVIKNAHDVGCNAISWGPAIPASALLSNENTSPVRQFVSGGADSKLKIWRGTTDKFEMIETLEGHSDWIRDVAWAPNIGLPYDTIASCSQDRTVFIWQRANAKFEKQSTLKMPAVVWRVSWSVTGNILAVSTADNQVTLFRDIDGKWVKISGLTEKK